MNSNPFPGPQPYRASDRARFHGRSDLSHGLGCRILATRCITVHGPSGAGKSSLVQASVFPALIDSHEIRVVRVDAWPEGEEPARWLASAMYGGLGLGELPGDLPADEAIFTAAQRAARRSSALMVVYLDQMEQLLYSDRSASETEPFFECLHRLVELPLRNVRVVLSLREDYLGRFRDRLRDRRRLLDNGFRVGPLTVAELTEAVCQAAASAEPPQIWSPDEMRTLMLQVRVPGEAATDEAEAQSAYAQIVCRALFQQRAQGGITVEQVAAEPILRGYFEETLEKLGPMRGAAERLLENHLVTADGSRTLRTEKELNRVLPAGELAAILGALERAAILHAEEHQGSRYFELGHDWLARMVNEQREARERAEEQRRREKEQQEQFERERALAAARLAKERRRRRIVLTLVSLAALAITGALGFWALKQRKEASKAAEEAEQQGQLARANGLEAQDVGVLSGFHELSERGQLSLAMRLLPEVSDPTGRRGWVDLASDALSTNALRVSLHGHEGALTMAVWSPDGKRVLTASTDGTTRIWNADGTGDPVVLRGHAGPVLVAAWSPDGERVVTASTDKTARIWNADGRGRAMGLKGHEGPIFFAAWSSDGKRVLTASRDGVTREGSARVFAAYGGGKTIVLKGDKGPPTGAAFHPDGVRVYTGFKDGTVRLWSGDAAGKHVDLEGGHTGEVLFIAVSPDGKRIVTTSRDGTARIWDAEGKDEPVVLKGHQATVSHAAWSDDGNFVATASDDGTARVWRADGKGEPVVLAGHKLAVVHVAFRPKDGAYVATASSDMTARLWPVSGGEPLVLREHEAPVRSAEWSPDGTQVLTAAADPTDHSLDHSAKVWSTALLQQMHRGRPGSGALLAASLSGDGLRVVSATGTDDTARLWYLRGDKPPVVFTGHDAPVASAMLSPDETRVVTASSDRTARIARADGMGDAIVLKGHEAAVRFAAFSPDGTRVVTVSVDKTARVWKAGGTGDPLILRGHEGGLTSAAWSPDGARLATTSLDRTARVWMADGTGVPLVLKGHEGEVLAAAFSPDGKRVVTASEDHTTRIWDAASGQELSVLQGHQGAVLSAIFSPDGKRVATSSADRTVRVWSADGQGTPIVLESETAVLGLTFLDGGQKLLSVASDGTAHAWTIEIGTLIERLKTAHADCLPSHLRQLYLKEPPDKAREGYEACERSFRRTPPPAEKLARSMGDSPALPPDEPTEPAPSESAEASGADSATEPVVSGSPGPKSFESVVPSALPAPRKIRRAGPVYGRPKF